MNISITRNTYLYLFFRNYKNSKRIVVGSVHWHCPLSKEIIFYPDSQICNSTEKLNFEKEKTLECILIKPTLCEAGRILG